MSYDAYKADDSLWFQPERDAHWFRKDTQRPLSCPRDYPSCWRDETWEPKRELCRDCGWTGSVWQVSWAYGDFAVCPACAGKLQRYPVFP